MTCAIRGCGQKAVWRVRKQVNGVTAFRGVCSDCRDELIALFGWELEL